MNRKIFLLLVAVVVTAFSLRFYKVTEVPPSLNWDEVSIGYNAYSILKTGKDEWGQPFPVHFKAFGEYKLPIQIYASIPAISVFGLNDFGIRITPVIYGALTVLLIFFLTRKIFKNDYIGLEAAFLLAISPWHIQLTRASFESSLAVLWVVLAIWLLIKGFENKKCLVLSAIPFALSLYTYNSARVFVPLFLLLVVLLFRRFFLKNIRYLVFTAGFLAILLLPLAPFYLSGEGNARYKLVSITDDPGLVPRINENRGKMNWPDPIPTLVHNKFTYISFYTAENYLAHFTPQFLFISGAPHKQHHVQDIGELYWFQAPFLLIGLFFLFKHKQPYRWLLTSWVLLAFIPVSVTNDSIPHALRTLIAVPFYQIVSAWGVYQSFVFLKKRNNKILILASLVTILLAIFQITGYLNNYYNKYPIKYSRDWQYGYKQVVEYINDNYSKYDEIYFSRHFGEPHIFTLFYLNYDPGKYQQNDQLIRYETNNWVWVTRFDNFHFPDLGDPGTGFEDILKENPNKKILFIGKWGDFPIFWPKLKTINFLDNTPAFEIVEKI